MSHPEFTALDCGGGDDLEIGHGNKIADFQFALADDCQGWGFHTPDPNDAFRALPKDDGRGTGQ